MAKHKETRAQRALTGPAHATKKHPAHKVHEIHVRRAASGGFIAKHDMEPSQPAEPAQPSEPMEHIIPDMAALHAHMDEHMGDQGPAGADVVSGPPSEPEVAS